MDFIRVLAVLLVGLIFWPARLVADDLVRALQEGNIAVVKDRLDRQPALIHEKIDGSEEMIHHAVESGSLQLVRLLVERGAKIEADSALGTALQIAGRRGRKEIAEFLLQKGARLDIHAAAGLGMTNHVKWMLRTNRKLARSTTPYKETPLHWAACNGHLAVAKVLLSHGANVSPLDNRDNTPLDNAFIYDRNEMVRLLLTNGAKVNRKDSLGRTPLYWAIEHKRLEMARILLAAGADVNTLETGGSRQNGAWGPSRQTPLHIAAARGNIPMIALLVEYKADVKATTPSGYTPLDLWRESRANPLKKARRLLERCETEFLLASKQTWQQFARTVRRATSYPSRY
jgi:ankyrin repeat protein